MGGDPTPRAMSPTYDFFTIECEQELASLFNVDPQDCVFIGDDPRWDFVGAKACGMKPIIIDRRGKTVDEGQVIQNLYELISIPQLLS